MSTPQLGRLEKIKLRDIWLSEPKDFTPWLANEENLNLLGEALGLYLELEAQEQNVGPFRADILCKSMGTDHLVLIENQLEKTDHTHLGQLLTYAAGLDTASIVWLAERFTDEHRAALDWLNRITDEHFQFFGVEIELWRRIGDTIPSPMFKLVCQPNTWSKEVLQNAKQIENRLDTPLKQQRYTFWTEFKEYMLNNRREFSIGKPTNLAYVVVPFGITNAKLFPHILTQEPFGRLDLYLTSPFDKKFFFELYDNAVEIEAEIGFKLNWNELPNKNTSVIRLDCPLNISLNDNKRWIELFEWYDLQLQSFCKVFKPRLKEILNSDDLD